MNNAAALLSAPDETWREEALAILRATSVSEKNLKHIDEVVLPILTELAKKCSSQPGAETWKALRKKFNKIEVEARKLAATLNSLTKVETELLIGNDPYDGETDFEDIAYRRAKRAPLEALAEIPGSDEANSSFGDVVQEMQKQLSLLETNERHLKFALDANVNRHDPGNLELSLPDTLLGLAKYTDARRSVFEQVRIDTPGPRGLRARLYKTQVDEFLYWCARVFEQFNIAVKNSESGSFFRFCATIYDRFNDKPFTRNNRFRKLAKSLHEKAKLKSEISKAKRAKAALSEGGDVIGLSDLEMVVVPEEHSDLFFRLSIYIDEREEKIKALDQIISGESLGQYR